jgi:hypothetical protein
MVTVIYFSMSDFSWPEITPNGDPHQILSIQIFIFC